MRRRVIVLAAVIILLGLAATGAALADTRYHVIQNGAILGTITPFSSAQTGAQFHSYNSGAGIASPAGVPQATDLTAIYLHVDTNTNVYDMGVVAGTPGGLVGSHVKLDFTLTPETGYTPAAALSNEAGEITGGPTFWTGDWNWSPTDNDGGVIANLGGTGYPQWKAVIKGRGSRHINTWAFVDGATGGLVPFYQCNPVSLRPVPEPLTVALFAVGLAGLGAAARRRRR